MKSIRMTCLVAAVAASASAFCAPQSPSAVAAAAALFPKPRLGLRVGGGQWNEFMLSVGADVTFRVPVLPLPALRVDAEVWGTPSNFGKDRRGNALSVLGVQTLPLGGYFGIGPSYYFTDDRGDHRSGLGAKLLGGWNFPGSYFVEGGLMVGPSPTPLFVSVGMRF